jgi:RNA polymerase sigma-70 factor (ECF subfamily)
VSLQTDESIDWREIVALYEKLTELTRSPVVELNRAVAVAQAGDTARALELVDGLELYDYQYLHSTRAELLSRLGRAAEARAAFERALSLARSDRERRFLQKRLAAL